MYTVTLSEAALSVIVVQNHVHKGTKLSCVHYDSFVSNGKMLVFLVTNMRSPLLAFFQIQLSEWSRK